MLVTPNRRFRPEANRHPEKSLGLVLVARTRTKLRTDAVRAPVVDTQRASAKTPPMDSPRPLGSAVEDVLHGTTSEPERRYEWLSQPKGAEGPAKRLPKQAAWSAARPSRAKLSRLKAAASRSENGEARTSPHPVKSQNR